MVEHRQPICKLAFEQMLQEPDVLYGSDLGSNYQGQTSMLGKHFVGEDAHAEHAEIG
jgi:dCTP deaminase